MGQLHYLTVQDILWINLQVTGRVNHYQFARLEEATFYQYAYGKSTELLTQAARFARGFPKLAPFQAGNEATALIAVLAFLEMNGRKVSLSDAESFAFAKALQDRGREAETLLADIAADRHDDHHDGVPNVKAIVTDLLNRYRCTTEALQSVAAA